MKQGKRIISAFLALVLMLSVSIIPVSAEADDTIAYPEYGTKAYGRMALLDALGFIKESDKADMSREVTRAEFAYWLCLISDYKEAFVADVQSFEDVTPDMTYADEISRVVAAGYMSGSGDGNFNPGEYITKNEAITALVRLTGRDTFAKAKGGYPNGYISVANSLKITDSASGDANAYNLLTMCFNTLDAKMLVFDGGSEQSTLYTTDEKVMEYFHNIYEFDGIVTANRFTRLYSEDEVSGTDTVEVDSIVYKTDSDYDGLLGMTVRGYYSYDEIEDERTMVSMYANNDDNKVITFDCDDLVPSNLATDYILKYTDSNSRVKQVKLARGFDYIYNNRADADRGVNDLFSADSITLIDRNTDGYYDTVIAEKCETMKLSSIDTYKEVVYCDTAVLQKASFDSAYMSFAYYDAEEDTVTDVYPEELEEGMVLSVYRSLDGMYIKAYATDRAESGTVEGYDSEEDTVTLSGTVYKLAETVRVSQFEINTDIDVLLDMFGRIAYIEGVGGEYDFKYGYLFSVRENTEQDAIVAKLVTANGETKLDVDKKVIIDGIRASDTATLVLGRQLIRYKINKDGKLRVIDTVAQSGTASSNDCLKESVAQTNLKIYPLANILGGSYKITGETFCLTVPGVVSEKENIELYTTGFNLDEEPQEYQFACYDIDENDMSIGACLYFPQESLMGQTSTDGHTSIGVIKKIQRRVWIDGEVKNTVTLWSAGGEATYTVGDSVTDSDLNAFDFGDVVRFVINAKGELSTLFMECNVTRNTGGAAAHPSTRVTLPEASNGYYNFNFGRVLKKASGYFVLLSNENNQGFSNNNISNRRIIYTARVTNCWMVDMSEGKIANADSSAVSEYISGAETPCYIYARTYKYYDMPHLIIYKY